MTYFWFYLCCGLALLWVCTIVLGIWLAPYWYDNSTDMARIRESLRTRESTSCPPERIQPITHRHPDCHVPGCQIRVAHSHMGAFMQKLRERK